MPDVYSKCGMNCGRCPWSRHTREALKTDEGFQRFRDRCKTILGYRPTEKPCLTCQTPDEELPKGSRLPPHNCLVRQCVDKIRVENCAYCSRFPCGQVRDLGMSWTREKLEEKHGASISEEDYLTFIDPFEGLKHLEEIRASLSPGDIVKAATVPPLKTKIVDFPKNTPFSKEETAAFKAVHELLATVKRSRLGLTDTDTFAQQQRLKSRMPDSLRFLWILGRFGEFKEENGAHLVVNAKTYIANRGSEKRLASWPYVEKTVFKILPEFGARVERVAWEGVKEKDLTTGTGYLRDTGWVMTMTFDEKVGGVAALRALQTYTRKLDEKYGRKAFRYFSNVDMQILSEN
jgi:hypothetical protein